MCAGTNCGCGCSASADGYDPKEIAAFINKHIYEGKASSEVLAEAYPKVMVWLDEKKLEKTEANISENKDELKVIINDPNYLSDKEKEKPGWKMAVVAVVLALVAYYAFFKE